MASQGKLPSKNYFNNTLKTERNFNGLPYYSVMPLGRPIDHLGFNQSILCGQYFGRGKYFEPGRRLKI